MLKICEKLYDLKSFPIDTSLKIPEGFDVSDKIAATSTSKGEDKDRPIEDVKILKAKMVKRK